MTDFLTLSYTSTAEIPSLSHSWSQKTYPFWAGPLHIGHNREQVPTTTWYIIYIARYRLVQIRWNPIVWPFEGNLFYITTWLWQCKSLWLGRLIMHMYVKYLLSECKHHQIRILRMHRAPCSYCTQQSNKILRNCHLLIEKTFLLCSCTINTKFSNGQLHIAR